MRGYFAALERNVLSLFRALDISKQPYGFTGTLIDCGRLQALQPARELMIGGHTKFAQHQLCYYSEFADAFSTFLFHSAPDSRTCIYRALSALHGHAIERFHMQAITPSLLTSTRFVVFIHYLIQRK